MYLINEGVEKGRIDAYVVNEAKSISHLIYADVIIFSMANINSLEARILGKTSPRLWGDF